MELDLSFKVVEVGFDQFERRKAPRKNVSLIAIQNKAFLASIFGDIKTLASANGFGIEVNEVSFNQFERRKHPR